MSRNGRDSTCGNGPRIVGVSTAGTVRESGAGSWEWVTDSRLPIPDSRFAEGVGPAGGATKYARREVTVSGLEVSYSPSSRLTAPSLSSLYRAVTSDRWSLMD